MNVCIDFNIICYKIVIVYLNIYIYTHTHTHVINRKLYLIIVPSFHVFGHVHRVNLKYVS